MIKIDKIGVDKVVVEGTSVPDLRKGPGHYTGSPLPGQLGNSAIAGHRTTYGAPFGDLDQLAPGDTISVRTLTGTWDYEVLDNYPIAVNPDQTEVLDPTTDPATGQPLATLTLTTCEPKYQATKRLVVKAQLTTRQAPLPGPDQTKLVLDTGLSRWERVADAGLRRGPDRGDRRWAVVAPLPPVPALDHLVRRRDPVRRRAVRLLHVSRTRPAQQLLSRAGV